MAASLPVAASALQWILLLGFLVPVLVLWGYAIASLVKRPDLQAPAKVMWVIPILLLPILGSATYFMLRPSPQEQQRRAREHKPLPKL